MIIKECTIDDLNDVANLFDQYRVFYGQESDLASATNFIMDRLEKQDSVVFLAIDKNNKAAGFTQLFPSFTSVGMQKIWILNDLFVQKEDRRKGVAKSLMEKAISYTKESGRARLILETGADNYQAQNLYESTGWTKENNLIYQFDC